MPGKHKNPTISFRPTEYERIQIETRIAMSGMQKRQYITKACIYSNIVVVGKKENIQRIVDAAEEMQQTMIDIKEQLLSGAAPPLSDEGLEELKAECTALATTIVDILNGAAYLFQDNTKNENQNTAEQPTKTESLTQQ